jgi:hypothetical protein
MTTNSSNTIKLTDTQLVVLSAASQRADRCIVLPDHLKGGAIAKLAGSLLAKGVAEEIEAAPGMPIVRRDGEQAFALVITVAGFAALGIEAPDAVNPTTPEPSDPSAASKGDGNGSLAEDGARDGDNLIAACADGAPPAGISSSTARSSSPREGTKLARVIMLLERPEGAAISDLMTMTGWLAHTTRAALTGLRKRGYTVELEKGAGDQESRYRITAMPIVAKAA